MPKVQNVIAPAPKSVVPKPAKDSEMKCGINEFKRRLADARKKDDAATADAPKAEQAGKSKRAKTNAAAKKQQGEPEAVDAPAEETAQAADGVAQPAAEEIDGEVVAETPEAEEPTVVAKTDSSAASATIVAVAMPTQSPAIADDEPVVASGEVEEGEDSQRPVATRPASNVPARAVSPTTDETSETLTGAVSTAVIGDDASIDEDPLAESAPTAPTIKRATKPAPPAAAAVAETEDKSRTEPKAVPASLASLEQAAATLNASQPAPASAVATDGADQATQTVPLTTSLSGSERTAAHLPSNSATPAPVVPVTAQSFSEVNHPKIVTSVRGELLPNGGTMQIRLDPPELGALQVLVHMRNGAMTASFQTSNDDATKLLSHSLGQLKQVLESQGVSVDKLHVQQAPRDQQAGNDDHRQQQHGAREDETARHEQQRKEMLRRMWRRLSGNQDPLDLVA